MLKRGIWFAGELPTSRMVELAQLAEQDGVDSVWMSDGYYARDALVSMIPVGRCGVDDEFLAGASAPVPAAPRLVSVGRLSEQKGQLLLVEALGPLLARSFIAVRRSEADAYRNQGVPFEIAGHFYKY